MKRVHAGYAAALPHIRAAIKAFHAASGMPLSENTEECLRPKAGSPVGNAETPKGRVP